MGDRRGYTLLELVLVLAVVVMVSAIAYPSLKGMYGHYKMTGAVDSVRAAWAQARAHAIEEGRPYRFAVVPDTGEHDDDGDDDQDFEQREGPAGCAGRLAGGVTGQHGRVLRQPLWVV